MLSRIVCMHVCVHALYIVFRNLCASIFYVIAALSPLARPPDPCIEWERGNEMNEKLKNWCINMSGWKWCSPSLFVIPCQRSMKSQTGNPMQSQTFKVLEATLEIMVSLSLIKGYNPTLKSAEVLTYFIFWILRQDFSHCLSLTNLDVSQIQILAHTNSMKKENQVCIFLLFP